MIIRNVRRQRSSTGSNYHLIVAKFEVFQKVGQTSRSRSGSQKVWYHEKGLVKSNTDVQYESSITSCKKIIAKVKDFQK